MDRSFSGHIDHSLVGNEICKQKISIQYGKHYYKVIFRNSKLNSKLNQGIIPGESGAELSSSQVKKIRKKRSYKQGKWGRQRQKIVRMQSMHRKLLLECKV